MRKRTAIGIGTGLACVVLWASGAAGDSIWNRANGRAAAAHADDVARKVGDNLTIVIKEQTKIDNTTSRTLEKKGDVAAKAKGTVATGNLATSLSGKTYTLPSADVSASADSSFDGKSDYGQERTFTDQITVTVEDVLTNGNLVVLGQRVREVDGDKQTVRVAGIVRPSDIAFDNTILSEKVADFRITFQSSGQEKRATTPGWLTRLLSVLNPN